MKMKLWLKFNFDQWNHFPNEAEPFDSDWILYTTVNAIEYYVVKHFGWQQTIKSIECEKFQQQQYKN